MRISKECIFRRGMLFLMVLCTLYLILVIKRTFFSQPQSHIKTKLSSYGEVMTSNQMFTYGINGYYSKRHNLSVSVIPKYIFGNTHLKDDIFTISKIVHQTAKSTVLPVAVKAWMQSWLHLNPDWQYWFWTDEDIRHFIAVRYPNFLSSFDNYTYNIQRADVFRYFLMYEFGGVYADNDVECLKPLDVKMADHDCIISQEPLEHAYLMYQKRGILSNAFIASRPGHPFYAYIIENLMKYYRNNQNKVLDSTGPIMLDTAYDEYIKKSDKENIPFIEEAAIYQKKIDPRVLTGFKGKCYSYYLLRYFFRYKMPPEIRGVCKNLFRSTFTNEPSKESFTVHHWTHTWMAGEDIYGAKPGNGTFHIADLFN